MTFKAARVYQHMRSDLSTLTKGDARMCEILRGELVLDILWRGVLRSRPISHLYTLNGRWRVSDFC